MLVQLVPELAQLVPELAQLVPELVQQPGVEPDLALEQVLELSRAMVAPLRGRASSLARRFRAPRRQPGAQTLRYRPCRRPTLRTTVVCP